MKTNEQLIEMSSITEEQPKIVNTFLVCSSGLHLGTVCRNRILNVLTKS